MTSHPSRCTVNEADYILKLTNPPFSKAIIRSRSSQTSLKILIEVGVIFEYIFVGSSSSLCLIRADLFGWMDSQAGIHRRHWSSQRRIREDSALFSCISLSLLMLFTCNNVYYYICHCFLCISPSPLVFQSHNQGEGGPLSPNTSCRLTRGSVALETDFPSVFY